MRADGRQGWDEEPLPALLHGAGVLGVSRLRVYPAFEGPILCTLVYAADTVQVRVVDARGRGAGTFRGAVTKPRAELRGFGPLASWQRLREAAFAAPPCCTATRDGLTYRHALLDTAGGIEATWGNPSCFANRAQYDLAEAYWSLVESSGLLLEPGRLIRIRSGVLTGFQGRVEWLDREAGRVRVVAELGGQGVSLELPVAEVEFPGAAPG
jgi:hypothetical protein